MGALCALSDAPPTSSGEATQELGTLQSRLYLNWLPPQPALERLHPEKDQKQLAQWGLVELLGGLGSGRALLSAFYS